MVVASRLARSLVIALVLLVSLRALPSAWCAREADALLRDELASQRALARGMDRWLAEDLNQDDFLTGSARFDGEWLFGTYMMGALGYGQTALAHPELEQHHAELMARCLDRLRSEPARAFDRAAWGHDPIEDLGSSRAHAAYLGYLNLALSLHRALAPDSRHAQLNDRVSAHLDRLLRASPKGLLETYPRETYPVDNAAVVASLALHERATGRSHAAALARWRASFEALRDPATGLLHQRVSAQSLRPYDQPRGSGSALAVYFLSFGLPEQSAALYESVHEHLQRPGALLGFAATREYPVGAPGRGDIDSGPVLLGVSVSATGFALGASRAHEDAASFTGNWATAYLFGAPVDQGGARNFALGGPIGDAIMFAMLTARPVKSWPKTQVRQ